jgi:hypothetical protein
MFILAYTVQLFDLAGKVERWEIRVGNMVEGKVVVVTGSGSGIGGI